MKKEECCIDEERCIDEECCIILRQAHDPDPELLEGQAPSLKRQQASGCT